MDKTLDTEWTSLLRFLPGPWREQLRDLLCFELRIRDGRPLQSVGPGGGIVHAITATSADIKHLVAAFSQSSLYAFEEELKQGYITLPGGHRVGFAGKALLDSEGKVRGLKDISGICLRVARSVLGCADRLLPALLDQCGAPYHLLVVSPPQGGKTTLLRDIARQVSDGGKRVCIVDERSEIAGCYQGRPQLDVGMFTDVLDGCPKAQGMLMALRALSPEVLVTDEIGRTEDVLAIEEALNAGVRVLATAHGANLQEVTKRPQIRDLMERQLFQRIIILSNRAGPGTVEFVGAPLISR
ncbi:MAG: stage III sporulation protein AA [Peptococcaceae bacterium]|nr:stage III sporulation protein AA [Peptococcaceae bacterium]